jgi:hypothetical protein
MPFPLSIRDRGDFPRHRLELDLRLCFVIAGRTEGISRAGAGHVLTLLASLGRAKAGWCAAGLHTETVRGWKEGADWVGSRFRPNFD